MRDGRHWKGFYLALAVLVGTAAAEAGASGRVQKPGGVKRGVLPASPAADLAGQPIAPAGADAGGTDAPDPNRISPEPPQKGNLLRNSSFELGFHHLWGVTHRPQDRRTVDAAVAFHGRRSIRLEVSPERGNLLASQFFRIRPFVRYTFSAYARTSGPPAQVTVRARSGYLPDGGTAPYSFHNTAVVGRDWQRIGATGAFGHTPGSACSVSVEVSAAEACRVWVDAVQMEEGDLSGYAPARPVEAALIPDRPASIFFADEPRTVRLRAVNYTATAQRVVYRLTVSDYWGHRVFRRTRSLALGARGETETTLTLPEGPRGSLRAQVWRPTDSGLEDELILSVLPRPLHPGLWPESTIGNHLGFDPYILEVAQKIGIHWSRDHDASTLGHWDVREPEEGRFVWADEEVDRALAHGISILPVLEKVPTWQGETRWTYPRSLEAWRRFVQRMVEHYRGRITHWDIWNEGWGVTGEQYGQLVKAAKEAARAVDPNARILFEFSTWQGQDFLEPARAVLAESDVVCTHIYTHNAWRIPDEPGMGWTLSYNMALLRDWLGEGASGKPLWMTEAGIYHDAWRSDLILSAVDTPYSRNPAGAAHLTAEEATRYIPRYYATWRAHGGDKWFYYWSPYIPDHTDPNSYVFLECDGSLHPMGVANAVCAHELDGSRFVQTLDYGDVNLQAHLFEQGGEGVAILWWQGSGERQLSLPHLDGVLQRIDMMGNRTALAAPSLTLTGDPIYLRAPGVDARRLAALLSP